jgi:adenosylcobinamide-phosphate guanylyltransferase
MTLAALVMAGGKATRMGGNVEKPLLKVAGKSMLQRVVEVIRQSSVADRIVVAATDDTLASALEAQRLGAESVITPGDGFEEDMRFAIKALSLEDVLVVSADLPFITAELVEKVVEQYYRSGKPTLAVMTRREVYEKLGSKPQYVFKIDGIDLVAVGINIIDGHRIGERELDQAVLIIESGDAVINVNTPQELEHARKEPRRTEAAHSKMEC